MAIDSKARRNAALIDEAGMLLPDHSISTVDTYTLLGQYAEVPYVTDGGGIVLDSGDPGVPHFIQIRPIGISLS